jgi:PAS domain S-box-containing protein
VTSVVNGGEELRYFNLVYQPYNSNGSKATGVFTISHDVTEQVKGRQKAQESEEKYRTLFESMEQGYCTVEILFEGERCVDYRYLETNPTFERHLGLTNALGKTIREIAPDIEQKWFDFYGSVALSGYPIRITEESPVLNKWFDVYAIRVGSAEERKVGVFFTDITARKKAEEDLNYRTALLEAQNEAIPDAILIVDTKGKILSFNQHFINLWKIPNEIIEQKDDTAALKFAMTQLVDPQGFIDRVNYCYLHPHQKAREDILFKDARIIERYGNAVVGEAGKLYGWAWYFRDVTEQRLAEETLKESEIRFRTLADESPVFVFIIDADSLASVSYWNKTWLTYTGQTSEEALGRAWSGILHADDIPIVMDHYLPAFKKREPYFIPAVRVRRSDGEYRWHAFKGNPRYLVNGDFNGYVGMGFDIHEQKLTQQQLETALEQARLSKEAAELGIFDLDLKTGDMHWDERCRTLFGISHK